MRMAEETHGEWWLILPGGSRKVILMLSLENRGPVCQVSGEQKKNLEKGINENKDIIILLIILTVAFSIHCNE